MANPAGSSPDMPLSMSHLDSQLIDLLPIAVYVCGAPDGTLLRYNQRAAQLWGREPEIGMIGERFCGSYRLYLTDGTPLAHAETPMAGVLLTGEPVHDQEAVIERPDGSRVIVQLNIDAIRDAEGKIVGAVNVLKDITERKRVEKALHQSEVWFRGLLENLPAAAYTCNSEGLITYYNQSAIELWGREPRLNDSIDRFCGSHKLFAPDGSPIDHDHCWMALALEQNQEFLAREIIIQRPDKSRVSALAYANPLRDECGTIVGAMNILIDISERKRLEEKSRRLLEALHSEWERLIEIFERSPAFMAVLRGPDHIFERANDRYYKLVGNRDIIGKTVREALPEIESHDFLEMLDRVYRTNTAIAQSDMRISLRKNGDSALEEQRLEFIYEPLSSDDGSVSGVLVHGIDLTERKRAEDQLALVTAESERSRRLYETILSNIPDLVYVFDLNCRFTYANQALLKMWAKNADDALGKTCLQLGYPAWHAAKHEREIKTVIATRQPIRDEVPFVGAEGLRIYDYIFVPVFGADGEVEAIAGTTRDVTERKQMEQELQTRAEELAAADRKKDEFIALLAHELRNPLAPVRNGLKIMELAGDDHHTVAHVREMMDRQLAHMVRLIDDLLDVSRMNRNKLHLQKNRVLISEVIANAIETVRPAIENAGHELILSLPSEPILLNADLTRLAQVFSNLLSNSAKYTKARGTIWLTAERHGDEVVVAVRDTGIGIPPAALSKIFEMFSQVPRSLEQSTGGLGIGLALVKALVELHGGTVTVESEWPNKGSTFTVYLPVLNGTYETLPEPSTDFVEARGDIRHRILVVDDNRDSSASMAMIFELLGHEVRVAYDGLEAVAAVSEFNPDMVLMDIGMPNLNGYDATRRIREQLHGRPLTIIAVTGWGQEGDRTQSKAAGCDGHLVKPVSLQDIEKLLAELRLGGS